MKRLAFTIILLIVGICFTGCTVVREYHRGYVRPAVVVARPPHVVVRRVPVPHHPAPRHRESRHHPRYGPRPR